MWDFSLIEIYTINAKKSGGNDSDNADNVSWSLPTNRGRSRAVIEGKVGQRAPLQEWDHIERG